MALTEYKFGDFLELTNQKNSDGKYGEDDAIGVNIDKVIQPMKGHLTEKDFTKFHLVPPQHFAYNPRGSRKLGIGFNNTQNTYIITFNDNVFRLRDSAKCIILATYLFMYLCRKEWDRYAEFISWGSSTEVFDWKYFCDEKILLPPISVQQKYVDIYNAMLANQQSYEHGLGDLKLTCDAYVENLGKQTVPEKIGQYLIPCDERNEIGLSVDFVRGLSVSKQVITTKANMNGVSLSNYKLFPPKSIAYVSDTSRRGDKMSLGFNDSENTYLVSSISTVFKTNEEHLLPEYLMLFFCRDEFDRYARFHSWGSARETFDWDEMCCVEIPVPDIKIQQDIVDIFKAYNARKEITEKLKAQIQNICPILIKGSIEEGMRTNEA